MAVGGLSAINRAFNLVPKRAESRQSERLRDTFVDSGIAVALESVDNQVLFGRRGTGKTHALRYLETTVSTKDDIAIYCDLRNIGSPGGLFGGEPISLAEEATRLLSDLILTIHDGLLRAAIENNDLVSDVTFVDSLDNLERSVREVKVEGATQVSKEVGSSTKKKSGIKFALGISSKPSANTSAQTETGVETSSKIATSTSGRQRPAIRFGDVAQSLRILASSLKSKRVWILLDEWSSVRTDLQPYLGEFLVRCMLSLQEFTVKIAAIEQQSNFMSIGPAGDTIGIEVGADVTANIDLDKFMVFDQNEGRARSFFRSLFLNHLTNGVDENEKVDDLSSEDDLIRIGFTDKRAFDELVKAAEGVPRDALNIAAKAALRATSRKISVNDIRVAGREWFQADKEANLRSRPEAQRLLYWIIDKVIKQKRARGFMVNQRSASSALLLALFDARVLHILRRGYSAQDEPGERYIVYSIDYGAYVDLMQTQYAPQGLFSIGDEGDEYAEVPPHDLRTLRRTILDLAEFELHSAS